VSAVSHKGVRIGWVGLAVSIIAALGIAYGAYTLAGISWDAVAEYRSPYPDVELPVTADAPSRSDRVVLIIIDGLRLDASREMQTLESLREHGRDYVLTAPQPSLSYPNWTTILSGAPPEVSGVVTNDWRGLVRVETLIDTAERSKVPWAFIGPSDFEGLYRISRADSSFFRMWGNEYLSATYVDEALRIAEEDAPRFMLVHLPDADEAAHDFGGASSRYTQTTARIDADLRRLVEGLQDGATTFVVTADHGHIDAGGHGGWEPESVRVPLVMAGPGIEIADPGAARLEDVAPTVAVLAGLPVPRWSMGSPLAVEPGGLAGQQRARASAAYTNLVGSPLQLQSAPPTAPLTAHLAREARVRAERLAADRAERLPLALAAFALAAALLLAVGLRSWRALLAALAGTAAYYLVYNALFFGVHGFRWSLSSINTESMLDGFMNLRLVETVVAALVAAAVSAAVYPLFRGAPKGPRAEYLSGWLALGAVTALVIQGTLWMQAAWFIWAWGVIAEWRLPDLKWAFKYDLDLVQMTALGVAAVLAPVVTYLVGRYHPRVKRAERTAD